MSEATDLVVIEKSNAMAVFTSKEQLDPLLEKIEQEVRSFVPDVTTRKGRDAIASMAHKVARSKTYIDNAGKDLVAELKALPKQIDESRRIVRERLDALKDEVRRPLTEWEAEQERLKQEEEARLAAEAYALMRDEADSMNAAFDVAKAEALRKQIATDHEMALLMNDAFDRDREEKRRLAEQAQRDRDEQIKREAAEQAKRDAEEKHRAELEAAARREAEARAATERAEREAREAHEKAEREKQEAIAAEQRKAQEEAARIKREAEQKEAARLAEEKRIADENARRAADKEHRRTVNRRVIADLTAQGVPEEFAQKAMLAIAGCKVQDAHIKY